MKKKRLLKITIMILVQLQLITFNMFFLDFENPIVSGGTINIEIDHENVSQLNIYFQSNNYTIYGEIYYPSNAEGTYPAVIFCEGFPGYINAYNWIPKALAHNGYVTLIYDPPGLGKSEGLIPVKSVSIHILNLYFRFGSYSIAPLHYYLGEWTTACSDALTFLLNNDTVNSFINTSNIGIVGHSLGGITATETVARDDRFKAVVALSHANPYAVDQIEIPIQFQCGDFDLGLYSIPIGLLSYMKCNSPKEFIVIKFGTHFGFTSSFNELCPCPNWQKDVCLYYLIGWFDYFLKNDTNGYETISTGCAYLSNYLKSRYNFEGVEKEIY